MESEIPLHYRHMQNPITSDLDYYEDAATYNENGKKFRELGFLSLLKTSATNIIAPPSTWMGKVRLLL